MRTPLVAARLVLLFASIAGLAPARARAECVAINNQYGPAWRLVGATASGSQWVDIEERHCRVECGGTWVPEPNGDYWCSRTGGGTGTGPGGTIDPAVVVENVVRPFRELNQEMKNAYGREKNDRASESSESSKPKLAPGCNEALDAMWSSQEAFAKEAHDAGVEFTVEEFQKASKKLAKKRDTRSAYRKAYDELQDWREKIRSWSSDLREIAECIASPSCSLAEMVKKINKDVRKWFADFGSGKSQDAAARVERAQKFLHDYGERLAKAQTEHASKAAECLGR